MFIPISAHVQCSDGLCGRTTYVVINPISKTVTDVVVKEDGPDHGEHLVPVKHIVSSTPEEVRLDCDRQKLAEMPPFLEVEFVPGTMPHLEYGPDQYMMWPYSLPPADLEPEVIPVEHEQIPPDEMAVRRGARVEATDGLVGHVSEFVVNPENEHITHLALHKGHLWNTREVVIPVTYIDYIEEDTVYLKIDKHSVKALPAAPAWHPLG